MAHAAAVRDKVRGAYVYERLPLEEAAKRAGVSYNTARAWKAKAREAGDDWDRARGAARMAAGGLGDLTGRVIEDISLLYQSTVEKLKTDADLDPIEASEAIARLSDALTKTLKAAGAIDPKIAKLSIAMQTLEEFGRYLRERAPEALPHFAQHLEPFGQRLSEVFG